MNKEEIMPANNIIDNHISKLGFLFISFIIIASGYVTQVLPCQTQKFLKNNIYSKHIIGILIVFLFIMLEGGWSFDMEQQNEADVDWSNGNVIDSLIFGFLLYSIFLLSAKMKLVPNMILYFLLFLIYLLNTQRLYWKNRKLISEDKNISYIKGIKSGLIISVLVFLYGIIDYMIYEKSQYKKKFSIIKFIIGNSKCGNSSPQDID